MPVSVNLLGRRQRLWRKKRRLFRLVQLSSLLVLLVYLVFLLAVFAYAYFLRTQFEAREAQIEKHEETIGQLAPVEQRYVLLKEKLSLLAAFFEARQSQHQTLRDIYELVPEAVIIRQVDFGKGGGGDRVSVSGDAEDVFALVALVGALSKRGVDYGFNRAKFEGIVRTKGGQFNFSLILGTQAVGKKG